MSAELQPDADLPLLALLHRAARWFGDQFLARLAAAGVDPITPAHATVLSHLDADTALSISELARRADVTRQTMHRSVTQLIDEGLLRSAPGPGFPRSTLVSLTSAGVRRRHVALGILHDLEDELGGRLGTETVTELRCTLSQVQPG